MADKKDPSKAFEIVFRQPGGKATTPTFSVPARAFVGASVMEFEDLKDKQRLPLRAIEAKYAEYISIPDKEREEIDDDPDPTRRYQVVDAMNTMRKEARAVELRNLYERIRWYLDPDAVARLSEERRGWIDEDPMTSAFWLETQQYTYLLETDRRFRRVLAGETAPSPNGANVAMLDA